MFSKLFQKYKYKLNHKPYPMPKINEMLFKSNIFHYAMSLDLNMIYYHIQLSESVSNLCTIILHQGKYWYKRLPMVISNSPEIFQQEINDLFNGFVFICLYIYDLLVLTKRYWTDHVHRLKLTLNKPKQKGIKCNIEEYFFA